MDWLVREAINEMLAEFKHEMPPLGLAGTLEYTRLSHAWKAGAYDRLRGQALLISDRLEREQK